MTLYAHRQTAVFAAALVATAILAIGALAQSGGTPTPAELAKYGWGAAATYAKAMKGSQKSTSVTGQSRGQQVDFSKYGWGAAATYAKLQKTPPLRSVKSTLPGGLTKAKLAQYGWGAAATYAKAMKTPQKTTQSR